MGKTQKVSAVEGWSIKMGTVRKSASQCQFLKRRRTLGDKTLKARFGVGEFAGPLFDFVTAEGDVV